MFRFVNFNVILRQLSKTMRRSMNELFGFFMIFIFCFMVFAHSGYLMFGSQLEPYSEFYLAMYELSA